MSLAAHLCYVFFVLTQNNFWSPGSHFLQPPHTKEMKITWEENLVWIFFFLALLLPLLPWIPLVCSSMSPKWSYLMEWYKSCNVLTNASLDLGIKWPHHAENLSRSDSFTLLLKLSHWYNTHFKCIANIISTVRILRKLDLKKWIEQELGFLIRLC